MSKEFNFCFPLDLTQLENDRLRLVPFDSNLSHHAELYSTHTTSSPAALANFDYLPYGPFTTAAAFLEWYIPTIQSKDNVVWFAIFAKTRDDEVEYAGNIAYLNAEAVNASVELGHLNILPHHQRTFVNTHACGLLLQYALNPASEHPISNQEQQHQQPSKQSRHGLGLGLGLRRTQWFANAQNAGSRRAAERLGFKFEGLLRWHRVLPEGKIGRYGERASGGNDDDDDDEEGSQPQPADGRGRARDSVLLGLCWDDWLLEGARERVEALMAR